MKKVKQYRFIYIMLFPVIVYFLIFTFYPLFLGVRDSFFRIRMLGGNEFIGIDNYLAVLRANAFYQSVINAFIIGGVGLIANLLVGTILAIMINEIGRKHFKRTFQTATYLPFLFSWAIVGGIWLNIFSTGGLLNSIITAMGGESVRFMTTPQYARSIMIFTNVWKNAGYFAVLVLAGIVGIDESIYESAQIDGASRMRQITSIMIPNLYSTMRVLLLLGTLNLFRTFDQVIVMENPTIIAEVRTVMVYIFNLGFGGGNIGNLGMANAAATTVLVFTAIITVIIRKFVRYDQNY